MESTGTDFFSKLVSIFLNSLNCWKMTGTTCFRTVGLVTGAGRRHPYHNISRDWRSFMREAKKREFSSKWSLWFLPTQKPVGTPNFEELIYAIRKLAHSLEPSKLTIILFFFCSSLPLFLLMELYSLWFYSYKYEVLCLGLISAFWDLKVIVK